jgi:hypothetical protein
MKEENVDFKKKDSVLNELLDSNYHFFKMSLRGHSGRETWFLASLERPEAISGFRSSLR